jgi:hypothetical protein
VTLVPDLHVERLRAAVLALKEPQAAKRAPAPRSSVFGRAAAAVPADVRPRTTREALDARFRSVETSALMAGTTITLLVLPDADPVPPALRRSLELIVSAGAVVVVLGRELPRDVPADRSRPLTVPLRRDDHLAAEWALLALGPAKRVAFLARRTGDDWDWMVTRDPIAVQRAGTAILERVPFLGLRVPPLDS